MANVTVIYSDLKASESKLKSVSSHVEDVIKQINSIKTQVSTLHKDHECFPKTLEALEDLKTSFSNYKETVDFLHGRCQEARKAFNNTEEQAMESNKKLTDNQKAVLTRAATMLGLTSFDPNDLKPSDLKRYENRSEAEGLKKLDKDTKKETTGAKTAKTWNTIFDETEDKDNRTNSIKAKKEFTESIYKDEELDPVKGKDKQETGTETDGSKSPEEKTDSKTGEENSSSETTTSDSPDTSESSEESYSPSGGGGGSSSGGGGGGSSSGGGGGSSQARKLSPSAPTDTSKEKAEAKKAADSAKKQAENTKTETSSPKKETVTPVEPNTQKTDSETTKPSTDGTNKDTTTTDTTPSETKPTESTPSETKPAESTSQSEITTPPSTEKQTLHVAGGSYSGNEGYVPSNDNYSGNYAEPSPASPETHNTTEGAPVPAEEDVIADITEPLEEETIGSDYTKIPASTDPITSSSSKSGGSSVIPIAAGLSAAAAAGIGAKAYMDRKRNNSDEDEFDTEEWTGDETMDIEYEDQSAKEEYLDDSDDYGYQDAVTEKYGARNNEELADLQ